MATKKPKTKIEKAIETELPEECWKAAKAVIRGVKPLVEQYNELRAEEQELAAKLLQAKRAYWQSYMVQEFENRQRSARAKAAMPAATYEEIESRHNARIEEIYDPECDRLNIVKKSAEFELAACRKKIEKLQNKIGI